MRLFKKYLPNPEHVRSHKSLKWLGPVMHAPDLWRFNSRSVAGGVAVGLFFAFVIPLGQFLVAAVAALLLRVNLPVAMTSTLITNPFTYAPWYYLAYQIGAGVLGVPVADPPLAGAVEPDGWGSIAEGIASLMAMGKPLMTGLIILAVAFAVVGYFLVQALWHLPAYLRLQRRQAMVRRRSS